jgi:hypothetical protein
MDYPYYIVQWSEGRLPCPPHLRCTTIRKDFESGRIGGRKLVEKRTTDPTEAKALWERDRFKREIYIVERNRPRRRITQPHRLTKEYNR